MHYIKFFLLLIILHGVSLGVWGQLEQDKRSVRQRNVESVNGIFSFQTAFPSGGMQQAIRNHMGNLGFGLSFSVMANPYTWGQNKRNSPLRLGLEAGYSYFGRFLTDVDIRGYGGSLKTSYGILHLNGILHLQPPDPNGIIPFVQVLAGGNFYLSNTKENLNVIESALNIQSLDIGGYSSASFNKGAAIGCRFGKPEDGNARFTIRASYNWGTNIRYVVRNSLYYEPADNRLYYSVAEAPVRYLLIQLGVSF